MLRLTVPEEHAGERLDQVLAALLPERTRAGIQKLISEGRVLADGKKAAKSLKAAAGSEIVIDDPEPEPLDLAPEDIPLDIVYEDPYLLVVNKPRGMVVHPAPGNCSGTLVNALLWHCRDSLSGINGVIRPGIVHRIDKDTSGLLIVAKTDAAHQGLAAQIKAHSFERCYEAVVHGRVKEDGTVRGYIARHPKDRKRMAAVTADTPGAREAVTHYQVIAQYDSGFTHLRCRLETGRTHQIRVQLASIGHPVAGDMVYGPKKGVTSLNGQCLHAKSIAFTHPITGERLSFESPLPPYFTDFLQKLRGGPQPFEGLLLAVDCDGTLLDEKKKISAGNAAAIRRFQELGGAFTLATGRSVPTASSYIEQLGITEPVILYNGAMIYDPVKRRPLWSATLPEHIKTLPERAMAQFEGLGTEVLSGEDLYAVSWNELVDFHLNGSYPVPHKRCGVDVLMDKPWIKILFVYAEEKMPALIEWLHSLNLDGVEMTHSGQILYEVLPKEAGKGRGLERFAALTGRSLAKAAVMGDYYNDLSLVEAAAVSAAPANACPEMKAAVSYVTPSTNEGDAVAEFIEYLFHLRGRG